MPQIEKIFLVDDKNNFIRIPSNTYEDVLKGKTNIVNFTSDRIKFIKTITYYKKIVSMECGSLFLKKDGFVDALNTYESAKITNPLYYLSDTVRQKVENKLKNIKEKCAWVDEALLEKAKQYAVGDKRAPIFYENDKKLYERNNGE